MRNSLQLKASRLHRSVPISRIHGGRCEGNCSLQAEALEVQTGKAKGSEMHRSTAEHVTQTPTNTEPTKDVFRCFRLLCDMVFESEQDCMHDHVTRNRAEQVTSSENRGGEQGAAGGERAAYETAAENAGYH